MTSETTQEIFLTDEAKIVVWRIFGAGASPFSEKSSYELIEPVARKYLSSSDMERSIVLIREWFEPSGEKHWLKSHMREAVAELILQGVGTEFGEKAIWAVSSIDAEVMSDVIRTLWSCEEIDVFIERVFKVLKKLCKSDLVLDASRIVGPLPANARIVKNGVVSEGRLETFLHLDSHGFDLVHLALHPAAGNLLELVIELRPEQFGPLVASLDHPVIQARAAHHMVSVSRHSDHRTTLQWIGTESCDALIALAIIHTLNTVNHLDEELRLAEHPSEDRYFIRTELQLGQDDLDSAAAALLEDLVLRLGVLAPPACTRWIGELLSSASYILLRGENREIPRRISQLEKACMTLCSELFSENWSPKLLSEFIAGLKHTPRSSWTRHIAELSWEIRERAPARASEIAKAAFEEHEQQIEKETEQHRVYLEGLDWHQRQWLQGLGIALVLSKEELDLPSWVRSQCRRLPLSVWDVEEDYTSFCTAHRVALHWFLVAFHAIPILNELGCPADPAAVCSLSETLWAHNSFARRHVHSLSDATIVDEYAARYAIEYGASSDPWLLEQIRKPTLGPLTLWALIDQRNKKNEREDHAETQDDKLILLESTRIAAEHFGAGKQFDLMNLHHWGLLWLLLGAVDEAKKTAMAILASPLRANERTHKIMALKLLAFVATKRTLPPEVSEYTMAIYRELWPGFTPTEERADKQWIDDKFEKSMSRVL